MKAGRRKIKYDSKYNRFFGKEKGETLVQNEHGSVHDTINSIVFVSRNFSDQTKQISKSLKGKNKLETARNIYNFCYSYFQYKEDAYGTDTVRTPNRAWADRKDGIDCDCYSALISCMLTNYGWNHTIRMSANFKADRWNHVYIILPDENGKEICIDPVVDEFNNEHPYLKKQDEIMEVSVLNGLGNPYENQSRRPLPNRRVNIIQWIVNNELRSHFKIKHFILRYAKSNGMQKHDVENIIANQMYLSDTKGWERLALSKVVYKRRQRNISINSRNVLVYLGMQNSNQGLFVSLMHDANFLEYWLENTLNTNLANRILKGIYAYAKNKVNLEKHIPFKEVERFAKVNVKNTPLCSCKSKEADRLIYSQDETSNLLQISIVVNSAPKGKVIKNVRRMYKPDATPASNALHQKLTSYTPLYTAIEAKQPLNGIKIGDILSPLLTVAGSIFGGPVGGAAGAAISSALFGGKKGNSAPSSSYLISEQYVLPNGSIYNPRTTLDNSPSFTSSVNEIMAKPYGAKVIELYNQIKTGKNGVNPTLTEYNNLITPFINEAERQIKAEQIKQVELARQKSAKIKKIALIGGGSVAVLGGGYFLYNKLKKK